MMMMMAVLVGCGSGSTARPANDGQREELEVEPTPVDGELPQPETESADARDAQFSYEHAPAALSTPPGGATDFFAPGPYSVSASNWTLELDDCELSYARFEPTGAEPGVWVILGHGFSRSERRMTELAEHIASHGVSVATPRYCFSGPIRVDHQRNAAHAALLSSTIRDDGEVAIHAGQSAGGLSALLATLIDPAAIALLGLDLTDADDLALGGAPGVDVEALGLFGEPQACNSQGNGVAAFAAVDDAISARVVDATHCDFEAPTNWTCSTFCGGAEPERGFVVRALAAAFVAHAAGADLSGAEWFLPSGKVFQWLADEGRLQSLEASRH